MTMQEDYKNNNIFYENTADLNIGKQNDIADTTPSQDSTPAKRQFNISLTDDEKKAQEDGFLKFNSGVNMTNTDEYSLRDINTVLGKSSLASNKEASGIINNTSELAEDYVSQEDEYVASGELWKDTLGGTAYADLKKACGLAVTDSYTDYYAKTGYIPKGYEMESRLLLAEEKRMKYYNDYREGKLSKTDFLYQAYGKDLMKESGHDLSSTLYWYNKARNNDFSNPLDSDTFLSDLIANAERLWQSETWYKDSATRTLGSTLASFATGTELTEETFQNVFKEQVTALKPYFDNDVKKIMTYYQAGFLGSAFSPFVDIDGDKKFDYYYGTDGKLYAVDDSSGTGSSKCSIVYNDDGSVHSVQVHEMLDGWLDSFWDGFSGFFTGFLDIGAMGVSWVKSWFGPSFSDNQAEWEAWKKRTIADEDRVVFDDMSKYNASDWGNAISEGVGTIAGMIVLLVATWGIGNILGAGGQAAKAGAQAGAEAAKGVTEQTVKTSVTKLLSQEVQGLSGKALRVYRDNALKAFVKESAKEGLDKAVVSSLAKSAAKVAVEGGASIARATAGNAARAVANVLVGQKGITGTVSQARSGALTNSVLTNIAEHTKNTGIKKIAANAWVRSFSTSAELALRDGLTIYAQLDAKNKALQYLEDATNGEVKALTNSEIAARAWTLAGVDFLVSGLFRAQGSQGVTSRFVANPDTMLAEDALSKVQDATIRNSINHYLEHMKRYARIDSAFDILENIITTGTQAAVSNPYAKTAGEFFSTAGQALANPSFILSNAYLTYNNLVTWGGQNGNPINTSILDDRLGSLTRQIKLNGENLTSSYDTFVSKILSTTSDTSTAIQLEEALGGVKTRITQILSDTNKNFIDNTMTAARELDNLFSEDTINKPNIKAAVMESFNLTEQDLNEINKLVKEYNKTAPANEKIGFVTGKIFYAGNKTNEEAIAQTYSKVLDTVTKRQTEISTRYKELGDTFLRGKIFRINKNSQTQLAYLGRLYADVFNNAKLDTKTFNTKVDSIINSFISKRFEMLTDIDTDTEEVKQSKAKELAELQDYLNSKYFKMHTLSSDTTLANTTYTVRKVSDAKGTKYVIDSDDQSEHNVILDLLRNYKQNEEIINYLVAKGIINKPEDDGETMTFNTGNIQGWFALELDNNLHNELLNDPDKNIHTLLEILDYSDMFFRLQHLEDEGIVDYNEPLVVKAKVFTGKTNGSGSDEYKTIYLFPTKIDGNIDMSETSSAGISDIANRLMAVQGILYSMYGLYKESQNGVAMNTENGIKFLAQLGALLTEHKAMDPFYNFLELYNNPDTRDKALENIRPAAIAFLSATNFMDNKAKGFTRQQILSLVGDKENSKVISYDLLEDIAQTYSSDKNSTSKSQAGKVAREILNYIDAKERIKNTLGALERYQSSTKKTNVEQDVKKISECSKFFNDVNNKELYNILIEDNEVPEVIQKLVKAGTSENFWDRFLGKDGSPLGTVGKHLLGLSDQDKQKFIRAMLTASGESFIDTQEISTNFFKSSKQSVVQTFRDLGLTEESKALSKMSQKTFYNLLNNPETFLTTNPDISKTLPNLFKDNKVDYNALFEISVRSNKVFSDLASSKNFAEDFVKLINDTKSKAYNYLNDLYKLSTNTLQDLDSSKISIDELDGNKVLFITDDKGNKLPLSTFIYKNPKTKAIITYDFSEDIVDNNIELFDAAINYYFKDTNTKAKQDIVELNVLNFLPDNLSIAISKLQSSKTLSMKTSSFAKAQSQELIKQVNSLLVQSQSSVTANQYKAYKALITEALSEGQYIKKYDLNNISDRRALSILLTRCGYDNKDIESLRFGANTIPGLIFKTTETHNVDTKLSASTIYSAASDYMKSKGILDNQLKNSKIKKNYINILYNVLSSLTKVTDDSKITLRKVTGTSEQPQTIYFYNTIYNKINPEDSDSFIYMPGNVELSRNEKGTLGGGSQIQQFLLKHAGFAIDFEDDTKYQVDSKSRMSLNIISLVDKAIEYLSSTSGKQGNSFKITIPAGATKDFEALYSSDTGSLFSIEKISDTTYWMRPKDALLDNPKDFKQAFLKDIDANGFDIKSIIPIWSADKTNKESYLSLKNTEFKDFEHFSNETLFSELAQLRLKGLTTIEDFINASALSKADTKDTFYKVSNFDEYEKFCSDNNNKTVKEILSAVNTDSLKDNYYIKALVNELTLSKAYSDYFEANLDLDKDLMDLANPEVYKVLGSLLTNGLKEDNKVTDFTILTSKDYNLDADNDKLVDKLLDALNSKLKVALNIAKDSKSELINDTESDIFTTADALKLGISNTLTDINKDTLVKLLKFLQGSQDNYLIEMSDDFTLPIANPFINSLALFLDSSDNLLSIPVEYFLRASNDDRNSFFDFLKYIKEHAQAYKLTPAQLKDLDSTEKILKDKLDIINNSLKPGEDLRDAQLKSTLRFEIESATQPSVSVDVEKGYLSNQGLKLTNSVRDKLINLVLSKDFNRKSKDPFIKLSSINLTDSSHESPFKHMQEKLLNITVCRNSDKPGSTIVANMDLDESIAAYFMSIASFASTTKEILAQQGITGLTDDQIIEIGMKANALTTGADFQAEYGSALLIKYNNQTKEFEVNPLQTSTSDPDRDLFRYLLGKDIDGFGKQITFKSIKDDLDKDQNTHYLLLKSAKNAFKENIDGYNDATRLIDLNNEANRQDLLYHLIDKAILNETNDINFIPNNTDVLEAVSKYYNLHAISTKDIWSNLASQFRNLGLSEDIIATIYPTVRSLNSANPTSLNDQVVYNYLGNFIDSYKDKLDSVQFKNISEAVTFGVNNAALNIQDITVLDNYTNKLDSEFEASLVESLKSQGAKNIRETVDNKIELIDDIVSSFNDTRAEKLDPSLPARVKSLSPEEQQYLIKKIFLTKLDGNEIFNILNGTTKSLADIHKSVIDSISDELDTWKPKHHSDITLLNAVTKGNYAVVDAEWLVNKDDSEDLTTAYQLGFVIGKSQKDTSVSSDTLKNVTRYNILIRKNIMLPQETILPQDDPRSKNSKYSYTESRESFLAKRKACEDNPKGIKALAKDENDTYTLIVDTVEEAYKQFENILNDNGVKTLMHYNGVNASKVNDHNLIAQYTPNLFDNIEEIDIRNDVVHKLSSRTTEGYSSDSMDTYRKKGLINLNPHVVAHDAVSDCVDELELYLKTINNKISTSNLYTKPYKDLAILFGEDTDYNSWSDSFKDVLSKVNFNDLELSDNLSKIKSSIDGTNTNFKRGNQVIKSITDAVNLYFEHSNRRVENRNIDNATDIFLNVYNSEIDKPYLYKIKNPSQRKEVATAFVSIVDNYATKLGKPLLNILEEQSKYVSENALSDASFLQDGNNAEILRKAIIDTSKLLKNAEYLYSVDTKNNNRTSEKISKLSSESMTKRFYSEDKATFTSYLAEALYFENTKDDSTRFFDKRKAYSKVSSEYLKLAKELSAKVSSETANNYNFYNILKNDSNNLLGLGNSIEGESTLRNETERDYYKQIMVKVSDALGLSSTDNADIATSEMSPNLKRAILNDLANPYGITEETQETQKNRRSATTTPTGIRKHIFNSKDPFVSKIREELLDKNGIFQKGLREKTALWSMGHEKYKRTIDGEYGTITIGEDLLTSKKAFKDLYGEYSANGKNEFYTLVWRQPLQQSTPMQVVKVKVVKGNTFSMSTTTADNYFNGDFDGDYYYFSKPTAESNLYGKKLWDLQTKHVNVFYGLFGNNKTYLSTKASQTENNIKIARYIYTRPEVQEAFKAAINNPTEATIKNFTETYGKAWEAKDPALKTMFKNLSPDDIKSLRENYLDTFGIRLATLNNKTIAVSDNVFVDEDLRKLLTQNRMTFMNHTQENPGTDAVEIGQQNKMINLKKAIASKDEIYRLFYNSTFAIKDDDVSFLSTTLERNKSALDTDYLKNYISSMSDILDKDFITMACNFIDTKISSAISSENYTLAVKQLGLLAQFVQQNIISSKVYNDALNEVVPQLIGKATEEDVQKYKALFNFMKSQDLLDTIDTEDDYLKNSYGRYYDTLSEEDKKIIPSLNNIKDLNNTSLLYLLADTELFKTLFTKDQQKGYIRLSSNNNTDLGDLYLNLVSRATNDDLKLKDDVEVITRDARTQLGDNAIGLGSAIIVVDNTLAKDMYNDTMFLFENGSSNLSYKNVSSASLKDISNTNREALATRVSNNPTISSKELKRFGIKMPDGIYRILAVSDGLNNNILDEVDTYSGAALDNSKLVLLKEDSLYNMAKTNSLKLGMLGSKAGKGTVALGTELPDGTTKWSGKTRPDIYMSSNLFDLAKTSFNLEYEELDSSLFEASNKRAKGKYSYYRIKDLALLNQLNLDAQDKASTFGIDTIGILQGAHGTGSLLNFGNMFLELDTDGNVIFNPDGYNNLKNTLHDTVSMDTYQDTNVSNDIILIKIAAMLSELPQDTKEKLCLQLTDGSFSDVQSTLDYLYKQGDLGGDNGLQKSSIIWNALSKEQKDSLYKKSQIPNKNSLTRVAFSSEINRQLNPQYASGFDDELYRTTAKKHAKPTGDDVSFNTMRAMSNNADITAKLENSAYDTNKSYVSGESVLDLLLRDSGGFLNKTLLKEAYDSGILNPHTGKNGNLFNGYKFIKDGQYLTLDYNEELQTTKKDGRKVPYSMYLENYENLQLLPVMKKSSLKDSLSFTLDNPDGLYDALSNPNKQKILNDSYRFNQLRYSLPFLSDGSDDSIYDAVTLYKTRFNQPLNTKYMALNNDSSKLQLNVHTETPERDLTHPKLLSIEQQREFILNNTKSPKSIELLLNKQELLKTDLDSLCLSDKLDFLNYKTGFSKDAEFLNKLCNEYEMSQEYENYTTRPESDDLLSLLKMRQDYNDVLHVAEIYSDDNGVKLVNSWLRSWGFKSTDNKDISLGNQTIHMNSKYQDVKSQILGDEYALLIYNAKKNKELYMLLNEYMNAQEILEAYDELTYRKDKWYKTLGADKYHEYFDEVTKAITKSGDSIESIRLKQQTLLKDNYELSILVKAASKINQRLMLEATKLNPYSFLSWFTDLDYGTKTNLLGYKNIQLGTFMGTDFVKGLNFDLTKMPEGKLASIFHTSNYGYVPMVEKIASQIAVTKSVDNLASYMKSAGYMKNFEVYNNAHEALSRAADEYFESLKDSDLDEDREVNNRKTFDFLVLMCKEANIDAPIEYENEKSIYELFKLISYVNQTNMESDMFQCSSLAEYHQKLYEERLYASDDQKHILENYSRVADLYESSLSVIVNMLQEIDKYKTVLKTISLDLLNSIPSDKVLVNRFGQKVNKADLSLDYSSWHLVEDFINIAKNYNRPKDEINTWAAIDALKGDLYLMDASVADQLEKKVFSKRMHSTVNKAIRKAKNLATTFIMATPLQLVDRMINFPMFDIGMTGGADIHTLPYLPRAMSTVTKFIMSGESLTDEAIMNDNDMVMFMRFLSNQTNQNLATSSIRGEKMSNTNIPLVRQYLRLANTLYSAGNLIPRFAYYLNLANSLSDDYKVDRLRTGVAFNMYDGISDIKSQLKAEDSPLYKMFGSDAQKVANADAQIVQIIAEHNGIEGNMPYAAKWLNENYNTMFLTFPMALVRWGKNRLQSLGYALMNPSSESTQYLFRQAGSVLVTQAILLAIQILLSQNTQDYLKKKLQGKEDEISEEEKKNAENILFRGGCVKLFDSAIKGDEVTTTAQNRGPAHALFNDFVADFIPEFNENYKDVGATIKNIAMKHTWGHAPSVVKDTVESIPGNTLLQTTPWYTPGENFFDNYGRKILGYGLGTSQANAFADYMQTHQGRNESDNEGLMKLKNAMAYAYSKKYSNIKTNKSEVRNYKKALQLVYDFYNQTSSNTSTSKTSSSSNDLKSRIKKAVETSNSSADVYYEIQKALTEGASYADIQKALKSVSLKEHLLTMGNYNQFVQQLDTKEKAILKTALLYEEENYPYLEDILEDINTQQKKEYLRNNPSYLKSVASMLKTFDYNTPTYRSYNSNRRRYNNLSNYFYNYNKSKYKTTPKNAADTYSNMMNIADYGTSKDIWGNETQHYKDGTTYTKRDRGFNPFEEGNK